MTVLVIAEPALFPAMHEQATSVSPLQYGCSGSVLDHLRKQVDLPARLETAATRRQVDFLAGRLCARRALCAAGFEGRAEIPTNGYGAPVWPQGYLGSISHCEGLAVAVAGRAQHVSVMGIDVERVMSSEMASEIRRQFASDAELAMPRRDRMSVEAWLTVLFSAKESLFKALHPGVGRYFDFLDVSATEIGAHDDSFTLTLRVALSKDHPAGKTYPIRFKWNEDVVMTRCQLAAASHGSRPMTLHDREIHQLWNG